MTLALPLFGELSAFVLMWGILTLVTLLVAIAFWFVNQTVGRFPGVGSFIRAASHRVEQYISNALETQIVKMEHRIWHTWYRLAHLVEWIGNEIAANAGALTVLANLLANPGSIAAWRAAINGAHTAIKGVESSIGGAISTNLRPITSRVARLERRTHLWYLAWHLAIAVTIPNELFRIRERNKKLEKAYTDLFKLLKRIDARFATKAFAGAVALALVYMGLGWVRCNSFKSFGKRLGCKGWGLLDDLLAGVIDVLVIADLCQLTKRLIDVAESSEVQGAISGIINGMDELIKCQGVKRPPDLFGYWTDPPPLQKFAALPAV